MDFSKYIGRDYESYNCLDLAKEFYRDHFGLELKNYFEGDVVPSRKDIECLINTNKGELEKVIKPKFGDIIVINLYGYASHIGVYIGEEKFLHSVRKIGSCLDSLPRYSKMVEGFYRHRERVQ